MLRRPIFCMLLFLLMMPFSAAMAQQEQERLLVPPSEPAIVETLAAPVLTEEVPDAVADDFVNENRASSTGASGISGIGDPVFDALPPNIQQEILQEAQMVYDNCTARYTFSRLNDCQCVSMKFIDARIVRGPEKDAMRLASEVAGQCPNIPGVAGFAWDQCQDIASQMRYGRDEYCTCYANAFAENYAENARPTSTWLKTMGRRAMTSCNEELNTNIYGD